MTDQPYQERIQDAIASVEENPQVKDVIELSSGVRLKLKKVPVLRIQAVLDKFQYPPVPEVYDKEKDRVYKNPFSSVYQEMRAQVDIQRTWAVIDTIAAYGTELLYCPPTLPQPESDGWIEELEVMNIAVNRDSKIARYLAWIKFVAIIDNADMGLIAEQFGASLGISEGRISESIQNNFPSN